MKGRDLAEWKELAQAMDSAFAKNDADDSNNQVLIKVENNIKQPNQKHMVQEMEG